MTTLPEAVEQAIHAADETNTRIAEAANGSDLTDLYTEWGEALTALRSAILAYGAARERQGIERAAAVVCKYCAAKQPVVFSNKLDQWIHEPLGRGVFNPEGFVWDYCKAAAARALPVDGATP